MYDKDDSHNGNKQQKQSRNMHHITKSDNDKQANPIVILITKIVIKLITEQNTASVSEIETTVITSNSSSNNYHYY